MYQTVSYLEKKPPYSKVYGYYFKSGIFAQYVTSQPYNHYSDKNWKVHVNYPAQASEQIKKDFLKIILGFLRKYDINHKIVILEEDIIYRMNRPDLDNSQNGKIITIYCTGEEECFWIMDTLDMKIKESGFIYIPLLKNEEFRNDRLFRGNPYIGYRFASTPRRPFYVIPRDQYGKKIEDLQKKYDRKIMYR